MKFLRQMDLYRGVILACLLLLPVMGWWINKCNQEIAATEKAIADATRTGGYLEKIGKLMADVELVEQNRMIASNATADPKTYFEGQIYRSVKGGLDKSLFSFKLSSEDGRMGSTDKQLVTNYFTKIDFPKQGGKDYEMSRETLYAILFNCESGAKNEKVQAQSIWRLHSLSIQNASIQDRLGSRKTPPVDIEDRWVVKDMAFIRREPKKDARK